MGWQEDALSQKREREKAKEKIERRKLLIHNKITEFWNSLLKENSKLDPELRLSVNSANKTIHSSDSNFFLSLDENKGLISCSTSSAGMRTEFTIQFDIDKDAFEISIRPYLYFHRATEQIDIANSVERVIKGLCLNSMYEYGFKKAVVYDQNGKKISLLKRIFSS